MDRLSVSKPSTKWVSVMEAKVLLSRAFSSTQALPRPRSLQSSSDTLLLPLSEPPRVPCKSRPGILVNDSKEPPCFPIQAALWPPSFDTLFHSPQSFLFHPVRIGSSHRSLLFAMRATMLVSCGCFLQTLRDSEAEGRLDHQGGLILISKCTIGVHPRILTYWFWWRVFDLPLL